MDFEVSIGVNVVKRDSRRGSLECPVAFRGLQLEDLQRDLCCREAGGEVPSGHQSVVWGEAPVAGGQRAQDGCSLLVPLINPVEFVNLRLLGWLVPFLFTSQAASVRSTQQVSGWLRFVLCCKTRFDHHEVFLVLPRGGPQA